MFPGCCYDIIPMTKLLPTRLTAQDHLTHFSLSGQPVLICHGNINSCTFHLTWFNHAREGFVENRGGALWFLLGLVLSEDFVSPSVIQILTCASVSVCVHVQNNVYRVIFTVNRLNRLTILEVSSRYSQHTILHTLFLVHPRDMHTIFRGSDTK